MKKLLVILLAGILSLSLLGCESKALQEARELIDAIGIVTLGEEDALLAAEEAVAALKDKEAAKLENLQVLKNARKQYDSLVSREKKHMQQIQNVEEKINAIGTVTLESGDAIAKARQAFNALKPSAMPNHQKTDKPTPGQSSSDSAATPSEGNSSGEENPANPENLNELQLRVSNYTVLVDAEMRFLKVRVEDVESAIAAIGQISLDRKEEILSAVQQAQEVYDSYPEEVQKCVESYDMIRQAAAELSRLSVEHVMGLIDAIGEVSLDSADALTAVKNAYAGLTAEERKSVSNYAVYTKANTDYNALKKEAELKLKREEARSLIRVTKLETGSPNSVGGCNVYFNFINKSTTKTIAYVNFSFRLHNALGDSASCEIYRTSYFSCYKTGPYAPGTGLTGYSWSWGPYYNWDIKGATLESLSIEYTDGSYYSFTKDQIAAVQE